MAYGYKRKTRRGTRRKRTRRTRKRAKGTFASKVKKIVMRQIETKRSSNALFLTATNAGLTLFQGATTPFNSLLQGTNAQTRIGDMVQAVSLQLNIYLQASLTSIDNTRVRIFVFIDKQPDALAPTNADLFSDPNANNWHYSTFNPDNVPKRYQILKDKRFYLRAGVAATTTIAGAVTTTNTVIESSRVMTWNIPLKFKTQYNALNLNDIRDIIKNSLWMAACSDKAGALAPTINLEWMFKYKDA